MLFFLILESLMLVLVDFCAVKMADESSVDSDLPDCNCDVTRQANFSFLFLKCISFTLAYILNSYRIVE